MAQVITAVHKDF